MNGYNCCFVIEQGSFNEWITGTRVAYYSIPLKEGMSASACFKETQYPK